METLRILLFKSTLQSSFWTRPHSEFVTSKAALSSADVDVVHETTPWFVHSRSLTDTVKQGILYRQLNVKPFNIKIKFS